MNQQSLIEVNPNKMRGTPVFRDTRVPIKNLFDCIEEGETIDQFLDQFPSVSREQVNGILELSRERLLESEVAAWRVRNAPSQERFGRPRSAHRRRCWIQRTGKGGLLASFISARPNTARQNEKATGVTSDDLLESGSPPWTLFATFSMRLQGR